MAKLNIPTGIKKTAVICMLKHEDQFLLLFRNNEPNKDTYTPVGGKLDPGESPASAAKRETFEETGIRVDKFRYIGTLVESSPTRYNWTSFVYLAEIDFIPPPECREGTLEWIPRDRLLDIPTPPTDWFIYQYALAGKPFMFSADFDKDLNMVSMQEEIEDKLLFSI